MLKQLALSLLLVAALIGAPAAAQERRIIATVNDTPITSFDVTARINLWKLLGRDVKGKDTRQRALDSIIDDLAAVEETKKYGAQPTAAEVAERLKSIAKGLGTDSDGLEARLKQQGISVAVLRQQVSGQIAFSRLVLGKYKEKIDVSPGEVDAKLAEIKRDIDGRLAQIKREVDSKVRKSAVTVYEVMEIVFPIEKEMLSDATLQSRFLEANQFASRFKGCGTARRAASGIFNVKVGKAAKADASKLPKQVKAQLDKVGPGKLIGPFRSPAGIQLLAFCDREVIRPQMPKLPQAEYPTREQVQNHLANLKFAEIEKKYSKRFRDSVIVEYRDSSLAN